MKVKLTYFRAAGKYYAEGEYETSKKSMYEIWDEVRAMNKTEELPGIRGSWPLILVNVPDHEHDHPRLLVTPGADT